MIEVFPNLFVGREEDCNRRMLYSLATIHACKDPCHRKAVGYTKRSLPRTHPYYLCKLIGFDLYLNIIDPDEPLFMSPLFLKSLDFIEKHIGERKVLVHCNLGESRAPSIALLYLSKRAKAISDEGFDCAKSDFRQRYPSYKPGLGIQSYLRANWGRFS